MPTATSNIAHEKEKDKRRERKKYNFTHKLIPLEREKEFQPEKNVTS